MNKTKNNLWAILVFFIAVVLFVIPMLAAMLAIKFPLADLVNEKESYKTYEGTKYSYFYVDDEKQAQKDFEDIAYYFQDKDLSKEIYAIIKTAVNPGEGAQVLKDELHIDLSDFIPNAKKKNKAGE